MVKSNNEELYTYSIIFCALNKYYLMKIMLKLYKTWKYQDFEKATISSLNVNLFSE